MIKAESLTKKFDDFTALNNISCEIAPGGICGIVGASGAGKSTLLRIMAGVYYPDSGNVTLNGEPIYNNTTAKEKLSFVPDEPYFIPGSNIKTMMGFYSSVYKDFDKALLSKLCEVFELSQSQRIASMSKGMRRQAASILSLARHTDYFLMDECFDGLDPVKRTVIKKLLVKKVTDLGCGMALTSHSLRELEDICDNLILFYKGEMLMQAEVATLKNSYAKVQIALPGEYDESRFAPLVPLQYKRQGTVSSFILECDRSDAQHRLEAMSPMMLDVLPLSLEEVFLFEVSKQGYDIANIFKEEDNDE